MGSGCRRVDGRWGACNLPPLVARGGVGDWGLGSRQARPSGGYPCEFISLDVPPAAGT